MAATAANGEVSVFSSATNPLSRSEMTALATTLTRAFAEDPVSRWLLAPLRNPESARDSMFRRYVRSYHRDAVVTTAGGTRGVALWGPPGYRMPSPRHAVLDALAMLKDLGTRGIFAARMYEAMVSHRPRSPHWYLAVIGTAPEARGKGLGSALLRERLALCDRDRVPAYLESSNRANLPVYLRHGFEILREFHYRDSPTLWLMQREPREA
jgi:ribosomal protein S18 acetylase RimI-like enzyme